MRHLKAQSILEYVTILGVVMMALLAMQVYMKRGIQAVVKVASDELGIQQAEGRSQKISTTDSLSSSSTNQRITKTQTGRAFIRDINMTTTMSGNTTFFETETGIEPPENP